MREITVHRHTLAEDLRAGQTVLIEDVTMQLASRYEHGSLLVLIGVGHPPLPVQRRASAFVLTTKTVD